MPCYNIPTQIAPPRHRRLTLIACNDQTPVTALLRLHIYLNVEHFNPSQIAHSHLGNREQFRPILVELNSLDRGIEFPYFYAFARSDIPEADRIVGGARGEEGGTRVDVDCPEGALVAMICAKAFAVGGEPGADNLVFGTGEEDVAVFGVSVDKSQRSLQETKAPVGGKEAHLI